MARWFSIIFENSDYLIVDKKSGISMHPAGRFEKFNLLFEIEKELGFRPFTVMRLDRETSGLVVFGKTKSAASHLSYLIRERKIEKKYLAVVFGDFEKEFGRKEITIDKPIGECSCDCGRGWKKCVVENVSDAKSEKGKKAQNAITHVKLVKTSKDKKYSLLEIKTETGRQHQIRVHLASIGHHIAGDKLYIEDWIFDKYANELNYKMTKEILDIVKCERLLLHCCHVKFDDFEFNLEAPQEYNNFVK